MLASLGEAIAGGVWQSLAGGRGALPATPGPEVRGSVPALSEGLVRDFVRVCGGEAATWRGVVPPHLFPQWTFPFVVRALRPLPYPLWRSLNAGARMVVTAPIPLGEPLEVSARLEKIAEDDRRVVLETRIVTGTARNPRALTADLFAFVPLGGGPRTRKAPETVPSTAREIDRWLLSSTAGLDFALLTGDFNPIHWLAPYARVAGFPSVILHGFASMARAAESLVRSMFAGDGGRLRRLDVRFARPLALPAEVALYVAGDRLFLGDAPGAPAYLVGSFGSSADEGPGGE